MEVMMGVWKPTTTIRVVAGLDPHFRFSWEAGLLRTHLEVRRLVMPLVDMWMAVKWRILNHHTILCLNVQLIVENTDLHFKKSFS
jgi:hypothetical protein